MPSAYTHYWSGTSQFTEEDPFDHTAGDRFTKVGITTGDTVFGITIRRGKAILIGRMVVGRPPVGYEEACALLPYEPWEAKEHLVARKGSESTQLSTRVIPLKTLRRLRFHSAKGLSALKFVSNTRLDQQTFRGVRKLTSESAALLEELIDGSVHAALPADSQRIPSRNPVLISRLNRDRGAVAELKRLHSDVCQLCGTVIKLPGGMCYSEGHHIRPLGREHGGSDSLDNLLCVCPNCHTKLDYGCIKLSPGAIRVQPGHRVSPRNISYHNKNIHGKPLKA